MYPDPVDVAVALDQVVAMSPLGPRHRDLEATRVPAYFNPHASSAVAALPVATHGMSPPPAMQSFDATPQGPFNPHASAPLPHAVAADWHGPQWDQSAGNITHDTADAHQYFLSLIHI